MIKYRFGNKIRELRERKGKTLKSVAEIAQISESLLSQIETNKLSPSIDTLFAVVEALDADMDYIFSDFKLNKQVVLVRKKDRKYIKTGSVAYEQISVVPDFSEDHAIEAFIMEIKKKGEKGSKDYGHNGKELGLVLQGEGILEYGTEKYNLFNGDSISFSSDIPHTIKNTGNEVLRIMWVITPPKMNFFKG
ncbi:cupin domain-containing protein [Spirochaetota bacterium]